ncbi:ABC transporter permease [Hyalangium minutum]|uniref:ABC transporter permease n=1 Tax=Hyalangium minutum TaxID=394096 RepID=UPI0005C79DBC|nr:ABC transporter permease subunit [Hyalangium minutum]
MDGLKEIAVIWSAETLRAIRSARTLVLLGLYAMACLAVLLFVTLLSGGSRVQPGATPDLEQLPGVIENVFKVNLFFLPIYVTLMGFDQISGEVGTRSIRYVTLRARLSSLLLGKFLVQTTLLVGLVLIIDVGIILYARYAFPNLTLMAMALNLVKVWLATLVFSLSYVALTTLCSSLFRASGLSLVFNFCLVFAFLLMELAGRYYEGRSILGYLRFLTPSYYSTGLFSQDLADMGRSGLIYLSFTLLFLGGAYGVLRSRDL